MAAASSLATPSGRADRPAPARSGPWRRRCRPAPSRGAMPRLRYWRWLTPDCSGVAPARAHRAQAPAPAQTRTATAPAPIQPIQRGREDRRAGSCCLQRRALRARAGMGDEIVDFLFARPARRRRLRQIARRGSGRFHAASAGRHRIGNTCRGAMAGPTTARRPRHSSRRRRRTGVRRHAPAPARRREHFFGSIGASAARPCSARRAGAAASISSSSRATVAGKVSLFGFFLALFQRRQGALENPQAPLQPGVGRAARARRGADAAALRHARASDGLRTCVISSSA